MSAIHPEPSLDSVYEAVQRGHAVLSLVLDAIDPQANDNAIAYSLFAAQREFTDVKQKLELILWGESQVKAGAK